MIFANEIPSPLHKFFCDSPPQPTLRLMEDLDSARNHMKRKDKSLMTTAPVKAGDFTHNLPEFGRTPDAIKTFGLKKGTLYNLHAIGKISGCVVRSRGSKSGCRLWDMDSIRSYIRACQAEQELVSEQR